MSETLRQRLKYILTDYVSGNIAWFVFNLIRFYTLPVNYSTMDLRQYYSMDPVILGQILFPVMLVALFAISGFYNEVFFKSRVGIVINTGGVSMMGAVLIFFLALFNDPIEDRMRNYEMVMVLWLLLTSVTLISRWIINHITVGWILSHKISFNTLIVGVTPKAQTMADDLDRKYPNMGFKVVAFATEDDADVREFRGQPVYNISDIERAIDEHKIDAFIIAIDSEEPRDTISIINRLFPTGRSIYITPNDMLMLTLRPRTQMVSGEVLIDVSRSHIPASTSNIKRISDIIVSALMLVLISPVLAILAIMVKRSSPGPVIYRQQRVGIHQKPFNIYKFRTMYVDSEANGPMLSSKDDMRITPVGRILRKYRLDELPQFWNVLRGDMSLVGPRPEREFYLRQIIEHIPYYSLLQQVRPGITSWGMVKYGYASTVQQMIERAKYDLLYIDNVSLIVDLKILLYTVRTIVTGRGV